MAPVDVDDIDTLVGRTFQLDVLLYPTPLAFVFRWPSLRHVAIIGRDPVIGRSSARIRCLPQLSMQDLMVAGDRSVSDRFGDNLLTGLVAI